RGMRPDVPLGLLQVSVQIRVVGRAEIQLAVAILGHLLADGRESTAAVQAPVRVAPVQCACELLIRGSRSELHDGPRSKVASEAPRGCQTDTSGSDADRLQQAAQRQVREMLARVDRSGSALIVVEDPQ